MKYIVQRNDSLWSIAASKLGDGRYWSQIAKLNKIAAPYRLYVGQTLLLPDNMKPNFMGSLMSSSQAPTFMTTAERTLARGMLFVLADERIPGRKVVRKIAAFPAGDVVKAAQQNPEIFGFRPREPFSPLSIGEHALGSNNSRYISASDKLLGASNFEGKRYWIDVTKAQRAGVTFHSTDDIIQDLNRLVAENPALQSRVNKLKGVIKSLEGEVLIEGNVPASAVKSATSMGLTRGLQCVQVVGMLMSAYDLTNAAVLSVQQESPLPITAETVRQVGGWGMGWAGAGTGFALGAMLGISTGPGALVFGAVGGLVFGVGGYFGFDWLADKIYEN